ncbi:MAG: Ig-like domain-containing protein, partial [Vicinamibacterales bacterium]
MTRLRAVLLGTLLLATLPTVAFMQSGNVAPVTGSVSVVTQEGGTGSGTFAATDPNGDELTFSVGTFPTNGVVTITNPATGAFLFTPNTGFVGFEAFTFVATDSHGAATNGTASVTVVAGQPQWPGQTVRASVGPAGVQANAGSWEVDISGDGRYVAFSSSASNLVAGDLGIDDVFVLDRSTGQVERVSVDSSGQAANGASYVPKISADGRVVIFQSYASNLVPNDGNAAAVVDLFARDRQTGQTSRINVSSTGTEANAQVGDYAISADGRFVAFTTFASNLVPGDTNGVFDVFVRDRQTGQTSRVSVASDGTQGNNSSLDAAISQDGRFVVFRSSASNLVPNDTNGWADVFMYDRTTGQTTRVSVADDGAQANFEALFPAVAAGGRMVVFASRASNLVPGDTNGRYDIFVRDLVSGRTSRVNQLGGQDGSEVFQRVYASADGRFLSFQQYPVPFVGGDAAPNDVVVSDQLTGLVRRVSVSGNGAPDGGNAYSPISADGRFVAFRSLGAGLVPNDTNATFDIFVAGGVSVSPQTVPVPGAGGAASIAVTFAYPGTAWTATANVPWLTVTPPAAGSANGTVSLTAAPNPGPVRVGTVTVALQTVTVTQAAGGTNQPPVATTGTATTLQDTPVTGTLGGSDADGDPLTFTVVTPPVRGTVVITNATTGAYTYTPGLGQFGTDSFTFEVTAAGQTSSAATVSLTIVRANVAPIVSSVELVTQEGVARSGTLGATDANGDAVTFSLGTLPTNGVVTLTNPSTGAFTFTPTVGFVGVQTFTFTATDTHGAASTGTALVTVVAGGPQWPGQTIRASVTGGGGEAFSSSSSVALSGDGRFVAFVSSASNLVGGDTNGSDDVFVRDRSTGAVQRVSVSTSGAQGSGFIGRPAISADGRFVAFDSSASTLVADDTNGRRDIFLRDRQTGQTTRVNVATDGTQANDDAYTLGWVMSADARYIAFISRASNLVPGDTNTLIDVFVRDRLLGTTTRVGVGQNGMEAAGSANDVAISGDGRIVAFTSTAWNLVSVPADTNGSAIDLFVFDQTTGAMSLVMRDGVQATGAGYPALSADGRYLAYTLSRQKPVSGGVTFVSDIYVLDRTTGQTSRLTQGEESSLYPVLSADGRYVAFSSLDPSLVPGDTNGTWDVFVHDRVTGETRRTSVATNGVQADSSSGLTAFPSLSADGRFVAFVSEAGNLVTGDTNRFGDVFVVGGVSVAPLSVTAPASGGSRSVDISFAYPGTPWTVTTATPWITLTPPSTGSANGTVGFTVAPNTGAARTGTLTVALQTVTVTQASGLASQPPTASNGAVTTLEDTAVNGTLIGSDPDGDALTFSVVTPPTRGTVVITNASTGAFTYTPSLNQNGADTFTFQVTAAGQTSNVATVNLTITPVNDAPAASSGTATT